MAAIGSEVKCDNSPFALQKDYRRGIKRNEGKYEVREKKRRNLKRKGNKA